MKIHRADLTLKRPIETYFADSFIDSLTLHCMSTVKTRVRSHITATTTLLGLLLPTNSLPTTAYVLPYLHVLRLDTVTSPTPKIRNLRIFYQCFGLRQNPVSKRTQPSSPHKTSSARMLSSASTSRLRHPPTSSSMRAAGRPRGSATFATTSSSCSVSPAFKFRPATTVFPSCRRERGKNG